MQQILTLLSAIKRGTLHWGAAIETMTVLTHSSEYLLFVFKCLRWSGACLLCQSLYQDTCFLALGGRDWSPLSGQTD